VVKNVTCATISIHGIKGHGRRNNFEGANGTSYSLPIIGV